MDYGDRRRCDRPIHRVTLEPIGTVATGEAVATIPLRGKPEFNVLIVEK